MASQETRPRARRARSAKDRRGRRAGPGPTLPSVANHPRAGAQVKQAKAWAGLVGFGLVALVSWRAGVPTEDLLLRALIGGLVAYVVVWACAVAIWRHLVVTELKVVRERRAEEDAARKAAMTQAAADAAEA